MPVWALVPNSFHHVAEALHEFILPLVIFNSVVSVVLVLRARRRRGKRFALAFLGLDISGPSTLKFFALSAALALNVLTLLVGWWQSEEDRAHAASAEQRLGLEQEQSRRQLQSLQDSTIDLAEINLRARQYFNDANGQRQRGIYVDPDRFSSALALIGLLKSKDANDGHALYLEAEIIRSEGDCERARQRFFEFLGIAEHREDRIIQTADWRECYNRRGVYCAQTIAFVHYLLALDSYERGLHRASESQRVANFEDALTHLKVVGRLHSEGFNNVVDSRLLEKDLSAAIAASAYRRPRPPLADIGDGC